MIKRLVRFAFLSAIGISLVSCGKTQSSTHEDTLDKIRRSGIIEACTAVDPPYTFKDTKTNALSGIDVDAVNLIAQKMNAKVNWHETTFGDATAALNSRQCDVVAARLYSNIPRSEVVAFTFPPLDYLGYSAIVRKNNAKIQGVKNIFAFDSPDITVAVATGEGGDFFVKDHFKKAKRREIDVDSSDLARYFVEVSAGRADVAISSSDMTSRYAESHPEVRDLFASHPVEISPTAWAVRQDDFKWLQFLNTALQFLDTQGTLVQLEKKYNAHLLHVVKQYKLH